MLCVLGLDKAMQLRVAVCEERKYNTVLTSIKRGYETALRLLGLPENEDIRETLMPGYRQIE